METKAAAAQIAIVSSLAHRVKYLKVVQADRKAKRIRSNKARRARRRRKKEEVGCWVCGLRHLYLSVLIMACSTWKEAAQKENLEDTCKVVGQKLIEAY